MEINKDTELTPGHFCPGVAFYFSLFVTIQSHANYDNMDVECMHS